MNESYCKKPDNEITLWNVESTNTSAVQQVRLDVKPNNNLIGYRPCGFEIIIPKKLSDIINLEGQEEDDIDYSNSSRLKRRMLFDHFQHIESGGGIINTRDPLFIITRNTEKNNITKGIKYFCTTDDTEGFYGNYYLNMDTKKFTSTWPIEN